jgi:tol-pal system protein YbgF
MMNIKKVQGLRIYISFLLGIFLISVMGCATTKDVNRVQGDLEHKTQAVKEEIANIRGDVERINETLAGLRKSQVETDAAVAAVKEEILKLKGITEGLRKEVAALKDNKELRDRVDQISFKINFIENFLEIGKRENHAEGAERGNLTSTKISSKVGVETDTAYSAAYETFREGKLEKSRGEFENFLKQHPNSAYSDNAQFWIGESYYLEKKYDKAVLEYEKVVKNYPRGNRVPHALLKQGLSFLNMGDKSSARLIFQKVIRNYPNTTQAKTAREKLIKMQ